MINGLGRENHYRKRSASRGRSGSRSRSRSPSDKRSKRGDDRRSRSRDRDRRRERSRSRDKRRSRSRDRKRLRRSRSRERERSRERRRSRSRDRRRSRSRSRGRRSRSSSPGNKSKKTENRSRSKEKTDGGESSKEKKKDKDDKEDEKEKDAGNFDQNKLEEEMRKRKERVEKWREEQRKKAMENIGELKKEIEEMKQGKKWSLEDDDDDEDDPAEAEKEGNEMEGEELDPLDAYMEEVKEEVKKFNMRSVKGGGGNEKKSGPTVTKVVTVVTTKKAVVDSDKKKGELMENDQDAMEYSSEEEEVDLQTALTGYQTKQRKLLEPVDHGKIEYEPFRKNFYVEVPELAKMSQEGKIPFFARWLMPIIPALWEAKAGGLPELRIRDQAVQHGENPFLVKYKKLARCCIAELKRGAEIIVCTPGRMIDMLAANSGRVTNLRRVTYVVLDEADRMFDMGFEPQVMRIVDNVRPDRQTVMFSATFPRAMEALARRILSKPIEVQVGGRSVVCSDVEQQVIVIEEEKKFLKLLELLGHYQESGSVIIFVDKQEHADGLLKDLMRASYPCMSLHGEDQARYAGDIIKALELSGTAVPPDLEKLWSDFKDQQKAEGKIIKKSSGFSGKGFKFDETEQALANERKKLQKAALGLQDSDDEDAAVDIDEQIESMFNSKKRVKDMAAPGTSSVPAPTAGNAEKLEIAKRLALRINAQKNLGIESQDVMQQATNAILRGGTILAPTVSAKTIAEQLAEKINAKLNYVPLEKQEEERQDGGQNESFKRYEEELEINDFPQTARWKVTSKEALQRISEYSEAAITIRGTYFPPGKEPKEGERKIYLAIESANELAVQKAKAEITRLIKEELIRLQNSYQPTNKGRYKVL
uniref:Probable ATP-dependent RNA helicase DDX46 n=1 Tax=Saimiri boliviensis boliviensis TaxID=39432 RepID=A0A2K6TRI1_SAIBB